MTFNIKQIKNEQLKYSTSYFQSYMKMNLKTWFVFIFLHEHVYIKGTVFFHNHTLSPLYEMITCSEVDRIQPGVEQHRVEKCTFIIQSKEEKPSHNVLLRVFSSQHSTLAKLLRATVLWRCTWERNLSSDSVKLGKMRRNDTSVWCICREMKSLLL